MGRDVVGGRRVRKKKREREPRSRGCVLLRSFRPSFMLFLYLFLFLSLLSPVAAAARLNADTCLYL